jgi:phenylalanyl-tRNA synthetase alpha chain
MIFLNFIYKKNCQKPASILKTSYLRSFNKYSTSTENEASPSKIRLFNTDYVTDDWSNINKNITDKLSRNLLHQKYHPLNHLANKIKHFFYKTYINRSGTPLFSVYDSFKPVVSIEQNFDTLLTPKNHVSRSKKDSFYVNKNYLLRSHMTAHDTELIRSGLNSFLTFGDVYRRDEIDAKHYPVFHQCDGVRLFNKNEVIS